jgi:hypothetical protein
MLIVNRHSLPSFENRKRVYLLYTIFQETDKVEKVVEVRTFTIKYTRYQVVHFNVEEYGALARISTKPILANGLYRECFHNMLTYLYVIHIGY